MTKHKVIKGSVTYGRDKNTGKELKAVKGTEVELTDDESFRLARMGVIATDKLSKTQQERLKVSGGVGATAPLPSSSAETVGDETAAK